MKSGIGAKVTLVLLSVMAIGIGAVAWWLIRSGGQQTHLETASSPVEATPAAPASPPGRSASAAITAATEALGGLGVQLGSPANKPSESLPTFDVARIESNGDAVIAGRAAPGVSVELLRDGEVHDRTMTDATGAFVLIPKRLPPGNYDLALRVTEPDGRIVRSKTSVAVKLGAAPADKPVVASSAPGTAAVVPPKLNEEKPAPGKERFADVRIDSVEAKGGGELRVSGIAAPGSNVRLFLNDAYIASGTASAEGQVQFSIRSGVKAGDYRLRLEQLGASGSVLSRAEAPFQAPAAASRDLVSAQGSVPSGLASASQQVRSDQSSAEDGMPQAVTGSTSTRPGAVIVPNIDTKVVVRGDNLWRMSQESYGNGERYTLIFGANRSQIRDPDLIYPGQIFVLPQTPSR